MLQFAELLMPPGIRLSANVVTIKGFTDSEGTKGIADAEDRRRPARALPQENLRARTRLIFPTAGGASSFAALRTGRRAGPQGQRRVPIPATEAWPAATSRTAAVSLPLLLQSEAGNGQARRDRRPAHLSLLAACMMIVPLTVPITIVVVAAALA